MLLICSDIGSEFGFEIAALKEMDRLAVSVQMRPVIDVVPNHSLVLATFDLDVCMEAVATSIER